METTKTMAPENFDDYSRQSFRSLDEFTKEVDKMEKNSEWLRAYPSDELRLAPLLPIDVSEAVGRYGWDEGLALETSTEGFGTQLYLKAYNKGLLVRDCAKTSLMETAKLYGSALGRMSPDFFADTLNYGFAVAQGNSMMLLRYGKLAALHSDGVNGYEIMSIPALLSTTLKELGERFGEVSFENGYNSHSYTEAEFSLPDAQMGLSVMYQQALESAHGKSVYGVDFMPTVRFCSSDTSNACATLQPMFVLNLNRDRPLRLCEGVKIKHSRKGMTEEQTGLALYEEEIKKIYAKFEDSTRSVQRLAGITLYHPENVVVGLCRKFGIPKRYGTAAYEEVEMMRGGQGFSMIAHDVFLAMSACVAAAKEKEASRFVINTIDEAVSRIAQVEDWSEFDVPGTVAWKD